MLFRSGGIGGLQEDARSRGETVTGDLQRLVQLDRSGQHDARHRVLRSLQAHRTQIPAAVLLHDDGVHAGREGRRNRTFDPRGRHGLVGRRGGGGGAEFGEDVEGESFTQEVALENAPKQQDGSFLIPSILGGGDE